MPEEASSAAIGDLRLAQSLRLDADRRASMGERLARLHILCKQMNAIKGAAAAR